MSVRHRCPHVLSQALPLAPSSPMTLNTFNQYWWLMSEMSILTKIIFLCAKKHMHIFHMLLIGGQNFKMNAWKPWEELITQSYYLLLKPSLKIIWVQNAIILLNIIFLSAKSHMHIFNMLITSVHGFKLIAWKLWEKLITQTCYPILKPNLKPNLKIV